MPGADTVRQKYLSRFAGHTKRNVIAYYSAFLTRPRIDGLEINDMDMNGFMNVIHGMRKEDGLDLVLHTPGGGIAATEAIVQYLRSFFAGNIRCFVPQLAMSAGTMIACACNEIFMGRQSSLGPIDPQMGGVACHGVVEEFEKAMRDVEKTPEKIHVWRPIIERYHPTFIGECEKAIELSKLLVREWLETGMFHNNPKAKLLSGKVVQSLNNHSKTKTHDRHISYDQAKKLGLRVVKLEDDGALQDLALSIHHAYISTFTNTKAVKIIESNMNVSFIMNAN